MDTKIKINLNEVEKIKKFTEVVRTFEADLDLIGDRFVIDAKSLLGIYVLNLSLPVEVRIISDNEKEIKRFNEVMEEFK